MTDNSINGKTKIYGVIGCPVEHTLSPLIHNTFAGIKKLNMRYIPLLVQPQELKNAVSGAQALGICGLNVTVPHKIEVIQYLCGIDREAEAIGAVNTLKLTDNGYVGYNTDIIGVYYAIRNRGYDIKGKNILLLGAGGAASACAIMAASKGAAKLYIANRTVEKAAALGEKTQKYYNCPTEALSLDGIYSIPQCDIVLNATVMGFGRFEGISPIADKGFFKKKNVSLVFDAVYSPWITQIMKDAHEAGIDAVNGFDMLVYQAVAAEEIWLGDTVPVEEQTTLCKMLAEQIKQTQVQ